MGSSPLNCTWLKRLHFLCLIWWCITYIHSMQSCCVLQCLLWLDLFYLKRSIRQVYQIKFDSSFFQLQVECSYYLTILWYSVFQTLHSHRVFSLIHWKNEHAVDKVFFSLLLFLLPDCVLWFKENWINSAYFLIFQKKHVDGPP